MAIQPTERHITINHDDGTIEIVDKFKGGKITFPDPCDGGSSCCCGEVESFTMTVGPLVFDVVADRARKGEG